ncbi:hypothetical protein NA56DRAFT_719894 [Hyaloscypha hepaticicola]|uniref:Uncharacterized protein n=1 Tax=Hyaloscypha hepaticicola TaxID=2082293 RepID=A0A2J6Q5P3_9HELO|nr:hypothetical protein NA56DRAFT_719894 [Hyaloscypha hepaticicola]
MDSPVASAPPKLVPLAFAKPLMWYNRPNSSTPAPHLEPQQMSNPSKLCAAAPAFVPRSHQTVAPYYKRADSSRGDIIITNKGAIRNAVQIVDRLRPNGTSYFDYLAIFEASDYDFVTEFKGMRTDENIKLLKDKEVEVVVMLKANDDEEKVEPKKKKNKSKKDNERGSSMAAAHINSEAIEKEVQGTAEGGGHSDNFGTANAKITTVIDTINALGPEFAKYTTSLWITLDFTNITPPSGSVPAIPTGPRATAGVNPNQPIKFGSNFAFITELVAALQVFTELKQMRINLRVRVSPTGFPFTLQQLALVLPFYDLGFVDWTVSYQDEKFTATVPIRDNEFPMKWLDQKRKKIILTREKKGITRQRERNGNASRAAFIEQSRTHGMFALSDFVKKSRLGLFEGVGYG